MAKTQPSGLGAMRGGLVWVRDSCEPTEHCPSME